MRCVAFLLLVLVQVNVSYQQNILPEHKRRHCKALQTSDIMEHALPEIRRILQVEVENTRRLFGECVSPSALKGVIFLRCEPGWLYHDNNCYRFAKTRTTWEKAIKICANKLSYLADIRSDEENRFVKKELKRIHPENKRQSDYHIGGYLNDVDGKWTWRRTGELIGYTDWTPNEPNNFDEIEHCLSLKEATFFQWNDIPCNSSDYFICKKRVEHKVYP